MGFILRFMVMGFMSQLAWKITGCVKWQNPKRRYRQKIYNHKLFYNLPDNVFIQISRYKFGILSIKFRSSNWRCSVKKGVPRNFTKFTGKHLCQSLFFDKVADLKPAALLKKTLWYSYFPVNFAKFLRTPFLQNTSGRLLTKVCGHR